MRFIHQLKDWPNFRWDAGEVEGVLAEASFELGKFSGRLNAIGFDICQEAVCETLATEILNSAEIEGERLNRDDVRSSVAKRMEIVLSIQSGAGTRESEARADMMLDATRNWERPMTEERLFSWHAALFPTGYSGLVKIAVGRFRDNRVSLPAVALTADGTALTCIGNDYGFDRVFSRQVEGLGKEGDLLAIFSSSGNGANLVNAVEEARRKKMKVLLILGRDGGKLHGKGDCEILIAGTDTGRIQEAHQLLLHILLDGVDQRFVEKAPPSR